MKREVPRFLVAVLLAGLVVACGQREGQDAAAPVVSTMTVTSVSPERESVLQVGDEVSVSVEVEYMLGSASGHLGLVVQTGDGEVLAEQAGPIVRGGEAITLQATFTVPQTDMVHLVVPLSERGRRTTSDVEIISYEVDPR